MLNNEERAKKILKKAKCYKMKRKKEGYAIISSICAVVIVALVGINVSPNIVEKTKDKLEEVSKIELDANKIAFNNLKEKELTTFNNKKELVALLKKNQNYKERREYLVNGSSMLDGAISIDMAMESIAADSAGSSKNYSETNTQVQGVDEADIVKTNGDYIYYLYDNILRIFDNTGENLKLVKEINYKKQKDDEYIRAYELYLTDEYIVVFASSRIYSIKENKENMLQKIMLDADYYDDYNYRNSTSSTKVLIYDINTYDLVREIETEGSYASSRKVDDNIYLITNKYVYYSNLDEDDVMPLYRDTSTESGEILELPIKNIRCFPSIEDDEDECSYMIITAFNLNRIEEKANIEAFIGTGNEIYCTNDNLYVTKTSYKNASDLLTYITNGEVNLITKIRKFAIYDGDIKYVAEGEVPGTLVNQFSMDEYDNYFRITTTTGETWDEISENNLYVLDEELNIVGTLEGLAKGEKIYSTRFMKDKCYVVTYKTVDPLFVIDLSEPTNPNVLGELKIPGYSKYLHPLGENYLIGFGEDSVEKIYTKYDGSESVTAYSTGLKLAIFDVTDYNNPKEMYSVKIGGRGSYSELLYNHKSLLYKEEEGLFAFPATLASENGTYENGVPKYGKTEFEGFLVFDLSVEEGIKLRGKIENNTDKKYYESEAQRILYIDDKLYSLFSDIIRVNDLETVEELDMLEF